MRVDGKTHELKCWPFHFRAIREDRKTFELRKNDRDFEVGDCLHLREWNPETETYTGHQEWCDVTFVLEDAKGWGLAPGHAILAIRRQT